MRILRTSSDTLILRILVAFVVNPGRLLLRLAAAVCYGMSWASLRFGRTADNKPYLESAPPGQPTWSLNISHHGDYVVLAGMPVFLWACCVSTAWVHVGSS